MTIQSDDGSEKRGADSCAAPGSASYHDVVCIFGDQRLRISDNYAYQLQCTKTGGWSLWWVWEGEDKKLAGEFDEPKLQIEVKGVRIL